MNTWASPNPPTTTLSVGDRPLTVRDIARVSVGDARPVLSSSARERMVASAAVMDNLHREGRKTYGVTTSVGASVTTHVPPELSATLSLNLLRMHGCGTGRLLSPDEGAAVLCVRLSTLAVGASGVRPVVAERLTQLLEHGLVPVIPSEGSVGASGDLTPMSYVAAVLAGEREVWRAGEIVPASDALADAGIEPITLGPKEALSMMNGTSVATAIAALATVRAARIARWSAVLTAMLSQAVGGNPEHFDAAIHAARPHGGQMDVAAWVRDALGDARLRDGHLQDRYSIRCVPHVVGVLVDALSWGEQWFETELNGVSDNPVVDVERGMALHGGNFYGGHVAFACDALKTAVANVACLADRQLNLLCNPSENHGLPANLAGVTGEEACTHNGFKAVSIATSALAAEALKLTMPASAFSRSTEVHNQDKVPMATIAARDLDRIVALTEQTVGWLTLAVCQAVDLRERGVGGFEIGALSARATALRAAVREVVPTLEGDRRMDVDLAAVIAAARSGRLDDALGVPA